MKSKKIIAMIVALASFMALATSSFAAVSTTTTYNEVADKVVVDVAVTEATAGSEVTYLVKNSSDIIVYIDQKTADDDGAVGFNYKIAKDKIADLTTDVKFGTNGSAAIAGNDTAIELNNLSVTATNATVTLYSDVACENAITGVVGDGDTVYAKVVAAAGYEVTSVKIGGASKDVAAGVYTVVGNQAIEVATQEIVVDPGVETPEDVTIEEVEEDMEINGEVVPVKTVTKVLKVVGNPTEVGVEYNGVKYPALNLDETNFTAEGGLCAVRIIVGKDVVVDGLEAYYEAE